MSKNGRILLANLLQSSRSTFSRGSFPSFFAFQEGMWDTLISALLSSPTVSGRYLDRAPGPLLWRAPLVRTIGRGARVRAPRPSQKAYGAPGATGLKTLAPAGAVTVKTSLMARAVKPSLASRRR